MKNSEFGIADNDGRIKISSFMQAAVLQTIHFILAILAASASPEEHFSPLGIAFCSGVKREHTLFSCLGAMLGYIISNDYLSAFRYVMALIIVYILRVYTNSIASLRDRVIIPPVISFFATAATGIVVTVTSVFDLNKIFLRTAESLTAFGAAYFFTSAFISLERLRGHQRIQNRELTSVIISAMLIILSMTRISFFGVTLSGMLCSYLVMAAAYIFSESGGAIIGAGASLGFIMTGNSSDLVFCYTAAGLFAGLFSYSGRVLCAMAYIFSYGAAYLWFGGGDRLSGLVETAVASLLFIMTPQKLFLEAEERLSTSSFSQDGDAVKNMFVSRLKMVREAVSGMSGAVTRVSDILKEKAPPDTTGVYLRVRDSVCSDCAVFSKCWKSNFSLTLREFDEIIEEIRRHGNITPSFVPTSLQSRCLRTMSLCDSFNKNYSSYSARLGAEGRIDEMRKITVDQFQSVGDMIDDLLVDFEGNIRPLSDSSDELKSALGDLGADAFVNCYEDAEHHVFVSLTLSSDCKISVESISDCLEKVTDKSFSDPVTVEGEKEKVMMFWEKPMYSVECRYHQLSGEEGSICGDCFDSFFDGRGSFIAVLSDGMGTGSRAAIDGAMASSLFSRLIISGFSFPCALRLVNSAMLVKSREESLATLDILKINLYNGQSVIYKAGAAVSLIKRMGKVSEIKKSAMPIGILRQAEFATVRGGLKDNDTVIMMSDGAADSSVEEIKKYLAENGYSHDTAQKLCMLAKSRCIGRQDDITVASVKIRKENIKK